MRDAPAFALFKILLMISAFLLVIIATIVTVKFAATKSMRIPVYKVYKKLRGPSHE